MGNVLGRIFRLMSFGESHGPAMGVVVEGCPAQLYLRCQEIQAALDRRRPGQSALTTARQETDRVSILSGLAGLTGSGEGAEGLTLGIPIAMVIANADHRPADYAPLAGVYRPSHADYTYAAKYQTQPQSGGGRASARETVARVAAGAVASQLLAQRCGCEVLAYVKQVHTLSATIDPLDVTRSQIEHSPVRCPEPQAAAAMAERISEVAQAGDSVGGVIEVVAKNVPAGLGEPVFDKLEAELAKALLSIPACRGSEVGSGFAATTELGSTHNDAFCRKGDGIGTRTNRSGGIQGGISNGEPIILRAAFKPTATLGKIQDTVNTAGQPVTLKAAGRHDPCVLPRAVAIVEAMVNLVLADAYLLQQSKQG